MKSLEDTFRRPRTASSLKHKKTGLELQFQPGKKWEVDSLIFSRHAKLQMLQRLLIVTAGIVGKLQLNRQVALVAYIFQSLDNGSIITNTAAGRNISSGNRVVILTVDIEDTLTAQHVNSPFRIDMLVDQMIGIQLDAEIVITNKVVMRRQTLAALPGLRLICIAATGMNNIDLDAAAGHIFSQ